MASTWFTPMLLCCAWGTVTSTTILSLTANPLFTMDALNGAETKDPEQTATVLLEPDLGTAETDPFTDGGIQGSSQTAVTSPAASLLNNAADGVENNINLTEQKPPTIGPKQPVILEPFSTANTDTTFTVADGLTQEEENNDTLISSLEMDKSAASDDHLDPSLKIPKENGTTGKQCFCNIPGPEGQKGDQGERGDLGILGLFEKKGVQGLEAPIGRLGPNGLKGEKGDQGFIGGIGEPGALGQKGESGDSCLSCPKGERGEKGEPGISGVRGPHGFVGEKGADGNPGLKGDIGVEGIPGQKGSRGPKGDKGPAGVIGPKGSKGTLGPLGPPGQKGNPGIQGKVGYPGNYGPPGLPGRKGEKGQKGACTEQDNTAFSVGLQRQRSFPLPGSPVRFEKVFLNINKGYNIKSGIFTANIEGIFFFSFHLSVSSKPLKVALFHNNKIVVQTLTRHSEKQVSQTSGSVLLQLDEDDDIYLQVLNASENGLMADANTDSIFSGVLLFPIAD